MTWIKLNWIDQNSLDLWHTQCRCSYLIIRWTPASLGFLPVIFSFSRQSSQELKDIVRWPGNWLFTINKSITRLVSVLWNLAFLFSLSLLCLLHYKQVSQWIFITQNLTLPWACLHKRRKSTTTWKPAHLKYSVVFHIWIRTLRCSW